MAQSTPITPAMIEAAAAAIANARGGRRGAPAISNILQTLEGVLPKLHAEVLEDAEAALTAALAIASSRHDPATVPDDAILRVTIVVRKETTAAQLTFAPKTTFEAGRDALDGALRSLQAQRDESRNCPAWKDDFATGGAS